MTKRKKLDKLLKEAKAVREPGTIIDELIQAVRELHAKLERAKEALEFYADGATYFAIGFFADPPAGQFMEDFDDGTELGRKPGKTAREALAAIEDKERKAGV